MPPALPEAAHADVESMLSRKFGKEVANYFSGSPLNRLSFLRGDAKFLSAALHHPSAAFLLLKDLAPLSHGTSSLAFTPIRDLERLLSPDPFASSEDEQIAAFDSTATKPQLVFLGVDESGDTLFQSSPSSSTFPSTTDLFRWRNIYAGRPFFALDVTPKEGSKHSGALEALVKSKEAESKKEEGGGGGGGKKPTGLNFLQGRAHMSFPAAQAAAYAEARALLDWNARNPFCAGCGQPTLSVNAGFKRVCPPTDRALLSKKEETSRSERSEEEIIKRGACPTRKGVSNLSFPRTDPTVIMAVVSADGRRILLGRGKRFPPLWYSTLAGFCEPAESVEEAVRREVWEESGIRLGRVQIHSTQPWPYPANLMIGAVGQALDGGGAGGGGEEIVLEHDPELEDAKWVPLDEVAEALRVGTSSLDDPEATHPDYKEGGLRLPPPTAIAHQLLKAVVEGGWGTGSLEKL